MQKKVLMVPKIETALPYNIYHKYDIEIENKIAVSTGCPIEFETILLRLNIC